ncbi:MAG: pyruvate dehydrogenase, partial [Planctomycetota bacterium]
APAPAAAPAAESASNGGPYAVPAGPAVRRFAREVGVDLARVTGTGDGGRITRDDVLAAVRQSSATPSAPPASRTAPPVPSGAELTTPSGEPGTDDHGPVLLEKVTRIRATIAANMSRSKQTAPHVTNFDEVDITELERIRQASKADYAELGIKLTSLPFVVKAVAEALRRHPVINASLDLEEGQIIYKQYVNVGIAVDTDRGLMVPVIRGADALRISDIARAILDLSEKARTGKLGLEEMRGGTFTISNLGAVGGIYSTPIINVPEVAILLLGRSRQLPVVVDGEIQPRLMMPLSMSYDHRLVDGAAAARYLNSVKDYLQNPGRMLLAP